jgi:hypothetical protein
MFKGFFCKSVYIYQHMGCFVLPMMCTIISSFKTEAAMHNI